MTVFSIFGALGLIAGDIFAIVGLIGATLLLLWTLAGRRMQRAPDLMLVWGISGTLMAALCFAGLFTLEAPITQIGFLGLSPSLVGGMIALSVALLGLGLALQLSRRPAKAARGKAPRPRRSVRP